MYSCGDCPFDSYNCSYVHIAVDHYNFTIAIDRPTSGSSSIEDPLKVLQMPVELPVYRTCFTSLAKLSMLAVAHKASRFTTSRMPIYPSATTFPHILTRSEYDSVPIINFHIHHSNIPHQSLKQAIRKSPAKDISSATFHFRKTKPPILARRNVSPFSTYCTYQTV